MQMLTDEMAAEVVAYDAAVRRKDKIGRRTLRYNYIVPNASFLGPRHPGEEVCILNVAVRLAADHVPVVKETGRLWPERGKIELFDVNFKQCAGWTVDWDPADLRAGKRVPFRHADRSCYGSWREKYEFGKQGVNCTHFPTVNPGALAATRYRHCGYSDSAPGAGLMEWLSLYRQEPKIELLAKAGLHCLVNPLGIKALKDGRVFAWVRRNMSELVKLDCPDSRDVVWAARHDTTVKAAHSHFEMVRSLSYVLDNTRWKLSHPNMDGPRAVKLKIDYERLAGLLTKWHVDCHEYGRYLEYAWECDRDMRNEGTLYPPVAGGRKAFMRRLEALESDMAAAEAKRIEMRKAAERRKIAARRAELDAFASALARRSELRRCGFKILLARTQTELRIEGRHMHNCVGSGSYGAKVASGESLIVMLRRGGKCFCDIEIARRDWSVRQCYLRRNKPAPAEVRTLANRIAAFLKAEYRRQRKAKKGKAA